MQVKDTNSEDHIMNLSINLSIYRIDTIQSTTLQGFSYGLHTSNVTAFFPPQEPSSLLSLITAYSWK